MRVYLGQSIKTQFERQSGDAKASMQDVPATPSKKVPRFQGAYGNDWFL
jgi:hypothetical protein